MSAKQIDLARRYGVDPIYPEEVSFPSPELFPKKPALIVRDGGGRRVLEAMTWGFPHIVKGASGKLLDKPVTNVRNLSSSFWRSALANPERRCLVPVTAFSEYGPGTPGKLPLHWFHVIDRPVFSFAGIWRPVAGRMPAFAFLTCEPNPLVAPIHPKAMPVILHAEDEDCWLRCSYDDACALAAPHPSQLMGMLPDRPSGSGDDDLVTAFRDQEAVSLSPDLSSPAA